MGNDTESAAAPANQAQGQLAPQATPSAGQVGAPDQSYPNQPPAQQTASQGYPAQAYPAQPYPGQQYPAQPYPGQPYPPQPYPGQQYQAPVVMAAGVTMPGGPPAGNPTIVHVQMPSNWPPVPMNVVCPDCREMVTTTTVSQPGTTTWLFAGGICLFGGWLGCCFIPFCVDACKDKMHLCPKCNRQLGCHRPLF